MRVAQWISAGLLLVAGVASAAPVQLVPQSALRPIETLWNFWDEIQAADGATYDPPYCDRCPSGFVAGWDTMFPIDGLPVNSSWRGELSYTMDYSESDGTRFDFHLLERISTRVDAGLDVNAYVGMQLVEMRATFQVFEPTLYTGTHEIYEKVNPNTEQARWDRFESGSILHAGIYTALVSFDPLWTATAHEGQSVYASRHTNWNYTFTAVPLPATFPLVLIGLAGIAWSRRRTR